MLKLYGTIYFAILISGTIGIASEVYADRGYRQYPIRHIQHTNGERTSILSLDEAVIQVKERTGGRILSANQVEGERGKIYYKIKYLNRKGVIRTIFVDPVVDAESKTKR